MPNLPCFHFNLIQLKQSRWSWDKKTIANVTQFHFQSNFISDGTDPLLYGALFILSIYFRWPPLEDNTTNCYDVHFQPWHNPFFFSSLHPKTPPINPPPLRNEKTKMMILKANSMLHAGELHMKEEFLSFYDHAPLSSVHVLFRLGSCQTIVCVLPISFSFFFCSSIFSHSTPLLL